MEWLNYHHLLYFWTVAREGSVTAAAASLKLTQPTVSAQVKQLEEALGDSLFARRGRTLELTELGKVAFRYADEIFTLGRELQSVFSGRGHHRPERLVIGVSDVVPKLMVHQLLAPALAMETPPRIICREDKAERLLGQLAVHELDLVIAETPIGRGSPVRAFNHRLGKSAITFFGTDDHVRDFAADFPRSLEGAPLLLPTANTPLRKSLERFFADQDITPTIIAEFEDSAIMKAFGAEGVGLFPGPSVIADAIETTYGVRPVGETDQASERFYVVTVERRIEHPAVQRVCELAKKRLVRDD